MVIVSVFMGLVVQAQQAGIVSMLENLGVAASRLPCDANGVRGGTADIRQCLQHASLIHEKRYVQATGSYSLATKQHTQAFVHQKHAQQRPPPATHPAWRQLYLARALHRPERTCFGLSLSLHHAQPRLHIPCPAWPACW